MNFEFCVGVFSICEGVGSELWLRENNLDGSAADRIGQPQWKPSRINKFDPAGDHDLGADVDRVRNVRAKIPQDRLAELENTDWHAFPFEDAFLPALRALRCFLPT